MPFPVSIEVYFPPVYYNQKPWKIQLQNESEYRNVKSGCMKGRVHPLYATLFPIRTNNLRNFSQDFFFPLSYHCVRGVKKRGALADLEKLVFVPPAKNNALIHHFREITRSSRCFAWFQLIG